MTIGYVNAAQVNYTTVNGAGGEQLNFGLTEYTQASQPVASQSSNAVLASSATVQPDNTLQALVTNAIASASSFTQATDSLVIQAVSAIGSSADFNQDAYGFDSATVAAIASMLEQMQQDDVLFAEGEVESIKAVLDVIQQAQTLSSSAIAIAGASSELSQVDQEAAGLGSAAIAAATSQQELDDLLDSIFKQLLIRKALGSNVDRHGQGSTISPRAGGNRVTVH